MAAPDLDGMPWELRQTAEDVRPEALLFWRSFEDQPDLAHLTDAARRMLAVSAVLFRRQGAVATSVRDIARAGGVSPGALYNHFASKEMLLHTLVAHGHARVHRRLDAAVRPDDPPATQLSDFVTAYVVGHLQHQWLAQLVRREYLHLSGPQLREAVAQRRSLRDRLAAILSAGQADGSFAVIGGQRRITGVAIMILDLCVSTTEWYDPRRGGDTDQLAELYVTAALRLVGA